MIRLLLVLVLLAVAVPAKADCQTDLVDQQEKTRFLDDGRFHWLTDEQGWRFPANVFVSMMAPGFYRPIMSLPGGLTGEESRFYQQVFDLLRDRGTVYAYLKELERKLETQSLESIFSALEKKHGFHEVVVDRAMSPAEWMEIVRQGAVITDRGADQVLLHLGGIPIDPYRNGLPTREGHWLHGVYSHRLQVYLMLRHFGDQVPKNVKELYRRLGDPAFNARLDWSGTPVADMPEGADPRLLYFHLFDSAENNASSPGFFFEYREYWPKLGQVLAP